MKTQYLILLGFISILFSSCATTSYYQVYKTTHSDKIKLEESNLVYEDDNCKVFYNLWTEGGDIGFKFYNKSDKNIYLNLEESFFVFNGYANNYFKNRVYTNSRNSGSTVSYGANVSKSVTGFNYLDLIQTNTISLAESSGFVSSKGHSVSSIEEKVICIPSKTSKIISEYSINNTLIRSCDLFKYPTKKQIKTISYRKNESPIVFSNRITYSVGLNTNPIQFENEFYVTEISNYPEKEIMEFKLEEYCGQKSYMYKNFFKNESPDRFYIKYTVGQYLSH
jgi:hypothetical protein